METFVKSGEITTCEIRGRFVQSTGGKSSPANFEKLVNKKANS